MGICAILQKFVCVTYRPRKGKREKENRMDKSFETALAGIKPANLFCWRDATTLDFARWCETLAAYGVEFRTLKACPAAGYSLSYLFQTARLREILSGSPSGIFCVG